jgi:hypothetical protein
MAIMTETEPKNQLTCTAALEKAYALALEKLPDDTHGRLEKALTLVQAGQVFERDNGYWEVASQREGGEPYSINGAGCPCTWHQYNPGETCAHEYAILLQRKALKLMTQATNVPAADTPPEAPTPEPQTAEPVQTEAVQGIDPKFIVWIANRPFVRHAGLLKRAHECGLQSLTVEWTHNDAELSLAHAVAVFADGRRFEENGDSTKDNVGKKVALHWRRISCTRASARALRLALGVDLVAVEELSEGD